MSLTAFLISILAFAIVLLTSFIRPKTHAHRRGGAPLGFWIACLVFLIAGIALRFLA
jgi:hypothetical protein